MKTIPVLILLLALPACAVRQARVLRSVDSQEIHRSCEIRTGTPVSKEQAWCIADLIGFDTENPRFTAIYSKTRDGEPIWQLNEAVCDQKPPDILQAEVRIADASITESGRWTFGQVVRCP